MKSIETTRQDLYFLGVDLLDEMLEKGSLQTIPAKTEILKEGQYVKMIPLVISGIIKVFSRFEDKDLLLYYIAPNESCIMSFSAGMKNEASKIYAITEEESEVLLLPTPLVLKWIKQYPNLNLLFYKQYDLRYNDLLHTISELVFKNLDQRLIGYLQQKKEVSNSEVIKITHRQIANEMGTAREVISRILKKLEKENHIKQINEGIILL